jgi:anthranilate synthase component 2
MHMQKKKVIIIDNYDSFTYNVRHLAEELVQDQVAVVKNDQIDMDYVAHFDYIIISPGPGLPEEAGQTTEVIRKFGPSRKILGICLGLQAIGEVYGGHLKNLHAVYHGIQSKITQTEHAGLLFQGVPETFEAGRYHSWVLDSKTLPESILITAIDEAGEIMAIQHAKHAVYGVQFHPESIMTPSGRVMMGNFLELGNCIIKTL